MKALIFKELRSFFSSLMGYLVIGFFLIINALFLFVLDSDYNLLNAGYNDLSLYFKLAPWVLVILVPALTMKSISEEKRNGTFELLMTKPLSVVQIVWAKYVAALLIICFAVLPSILYIFLLNSYALQSMDLGSTLGSFLGLFLLAGLYASLGIFASCLSQNQLVSLLVGIVLCLFFFFAWEELAQLMSLSKLSAVGARAHFLSISRGVIDTRDLIYFISLIVFVNYSSVILLKKQAL